jgi:hypothetical protein
MNWLLLILYKGNLNLMTCAYPFLDISKGQHIPAKKGGANICTGTALTLKWPRSANIASVPVFMPNIFCV